MQNIHSEMKGDKLILTIDVSEAKVKAAPLSASKKTFLVASTGGFANLGAVGLNLNVTVRNPDYSPAK